jgi:hypothetical protein
MQLAGTEPTFPRLIFLNLLVADVEDRTGFALFKAARRLRSLAPILSGFGGFIDPR